MNIWTRSLIAGAGLAVIVTGIYTTFLNKTRKPTYKVTLFTEIAGDADDPIRTMDATREILLRRAESAHFNAKVKASGNLKFDIILRHIDDTSLPRQVMTGNNRLEFRETYQLPQLAEFLAKADKIATTYIPHENLRPIDDNELPDTTLPPEILKCVKPPGDFDENRSGEAGLLSIIQLNGINPSNFSTPGAIGLVKEKDTVLLNAILGNSELQAVLPADIEFQYGPVRDFRTGHTMNDHQLYAIRGHGQDNYPLTNESIVSARSTLNQLGDPEVVFQFNDPGSQAWARMTQNNQGRYIAIIIDESVISAPQVLGRIDGGWSSISGGLSESETRVLAAHLNGGSLPAELKIMEQEIAGEGHLAAASLVLILAAALSVFTGLAYLVFNALKNR